VQDPTFVVHKLDASQSFVMLEGLILLRARGVPSAESVLSFIDHIRAARPTPWGVLHFIELEKVGLPDERTRSAYAALMRNANESGRATALVAERPLQQSIVRSVVSGLRLLTKHDAKTETFSNLEDAAIWLESIRPADAAKVPVASLAGALRAIRDEHR
jgi:hypothetical protein